MRLVCMKILIANMNLFINMCIHVRTHFFQVMLCENVLTEVAVNIGMLQVRLLFSISVNIQ